mgnify:CR=1 FL=1
MSKSISEVNLFKDDDETFLMSQFSNKEVDAKKLYLKFVKQCTDENIKRVKR